MENEYNQGSKKTINPKAKGGFKVIPIEETLIEITDEDGQSIKLRLNRNHLMALRQELDRKLGKI